MRKRKVTASLIEEVKELKTKYKLPAKDIARLCKISSATASNIKSGGYTLEGYKGVIRRHKKATKRVEKETPVVVNKEDQIITLLTEIRDLLENKRIW